MPQLIHPEELTSILRIIAKHKTITMTALQATLSLQKRTLQRRLSLLVQQKKIGAVGSGRNRYYQYLPIADDVIPQETIALSQAGELILQKIRQPITKKKPLGYQRKFLDAYRPNKTFYLTEKIRKHLLHHGKVFSEKKSAGTYAHTIFQRLLIDLSWNSSRLEGNTYSLLETQRLLDFGKAARGKNSQETQMILNHKNAISLLVEEAEKIRFNRYTILNLHALLAENLLGNSAECGRLRTVAVEIGQTPYLPLAMPQLIDECFQQILDVTQTIANPFEQSFFVMVHLPYLQPFIDINKRVSRLSANIPLIKNNLCPLSFIGVPQRSYINGILGVYELNKIELLRDVYVYAYEQSCARYSVLHQSIGEPNLFHLQHRTLIANTMQHIVFEKLNPEKALRYIRAQAEKHLLKNAQAEFVEHIETELLSLHEGSILRYRIPLEKYQAWQKVFVAV